MGLLGIEHTRLARLRVHAGCMVGLLGHPLQLVVAHAATLGVSFTSGNHIAGACLIVSFVLIFVSAGKGKPNPQFEDYR